MHIITIITLTSDKFALVKVGFSIRNLIHQDSGGQYHGRGPVPGASHHSERQFNATPAYTMQWDRITYVRRLCTLAYLSQFVGRCRRQPSPSISAPTWKSEAKQDDSIFRNHSRLQSHQRSRARKTAGKPCMNSTTGISILGLTHHVT
jgi:hypothetical protein